MLVGIESGHKQALHINLLACRAQLCSNEMHDYKNTPNAASRHTGLKWIVTEYDLGRYDPFTL